MSSKQRAKPIARVYDRSDGEHVANLLNPSLVHEFRESPLWDVEVLEDVTDISTEEDHE